MVAGVYVIYMLILKITGHSPDTITVLTWFVTAIIALQIFSLGLLISITKDISYIKWEIKGFNQFKSSMIKKF